MTVTTPFQLDDRTATILEHRRRVSMRRGALIRRALLIADIAGLVFAALVAEAVFDRRGGTNAFSSLSETGIFAASLPFWVILAKLYGLYEKDEERTDHSTADEVVRVFHLVSVTSWLMTGVFYFTRIADPPLSKIFMFWAAAVAAVPLARAAARTYCRSQLAYVQNTVILGSGETAAMLARKLTNHPEYGLNLVGFVHGAEEAAAGDDAPWLGDVDDLLDALKPFDIERAIVASPEMPDDELVALVRLLNEQFVQVDIVPSLWEVVPPQGGVGVHALEGVPLWGLPPARLSRSSLFLKRGVDVVLSTVTLLVLAPLFAVVAAAIVLDSGRPVFFRQTRTGRNDRPFRIWKFRTMTVDADVRKHEVAHLNKHRDGDPRMFKIDDDPRTTPVGRLLRRLSIDELPQLLNVLRGQMSLVGPRPLIMDESVHVRNWATRRLHLRPGITGLWQVLGRDDINFEEMIRLDYHYVSTWSLASDLWIIIRTIPAVCRSRRRP